MMLRHCVLLILGLGLINALPLDEARPDEARPVVEEASSEFRLSLGMNNMAVNLFNVINSLEKSNVVVSPFSIHTSLSMTFYGTAIGSETRRELSAFLGLEEAHLDEYLLEYLKLLQRYDSVRKQYETDVQFANGLFVQDGLEPGKEYADILDVYYKTNVQNLNFSRSVESAEAINTFVEEHTDNRIKDLVSPALLTSNTVLVLVNAVLFRAQWKTPFDEHYTRPGLFHVSETQSFEHEAIMGTDGEFNVADLTNELDARVLELPYEDDAFRMLVFLPNENSHVHLLSQRLVNFDFVADTIDEKLKPALVGVQLPRLRVNFQRDLVDDMRVLGLNNLFEFREDLSPMLESSNTSLRVSAVVHSADIDIDEMGVVAAAATAQVIDTRSGYELDTTFLVNRPFVVMIQDKLLKIPLFLATIVDPSGENREMEPLNEDQLQLLEAIKRGEQPMEELALDVMDNVENEGNDKHDNDPDADQKKQESVVNRISGEDEENDDDNEEDVEILEDKESSKKCTESGFMVDPNSDEDSVHFPCTKVDDELADDELADDELGDDQLVEDQLAVESQVTSDSNDS